MQISQTEGYITQDAIADSFRKDTIPAGLQGPTKSYTSFENSAIISTDIPVEAVREGGVEALHHQHWQLGALLEVYPQKLHYTRVMQATKHFAFV